MRIGKFLAFQGIAPRRKTADFLKNHSVCWNGERIRELNFIIDKKQGDLLTIDGKKISLSQAIYIAFHKPKGYTVSHRNFKNSPTIYQLLPSKYKNFFFAGRLDHNSRGLMLLSNDGDWIYSITHPSKQIAKHYQVNTQRPLSSEEIRRAISGVFNRGEKLSISEIFTIKPSLYRFILHHGKKREIRRILKHFNIEVKDLFRTKIGHLKVDSIKEAHFIQLNKDQVSF